MFRAKLTLIVAVALLLTGCHEDPSAGGTPPVNQGPANVGCTVQPHHPHQSSHQPTRINAEVSVTCSGAIASLTIDVQVQRSRKGSKWERLAGDRKEFAPATSGLEYRWHADIACGMSQPGDKLRTAGRGSGVFGGKPAGSAWKHNPEGGKEVICK